MAVCNSPLEVEKGTFEEGGGGGVIMMSKLTGTVY